MASGLKNSIRAAVLLVVFSLNTVIGFACSIGIDMGFNSTHHGSEHHSANHNTKHHGSSHHDHSPAQASVHIHKDGKRHVHSGKNSSHDHSTSHTHSATAETKGEARENDKCCTNDVLQFQQLDKSVPHSAIVVHPDFLTAYVYAFYNSLLPTTQIAKDIKQFVRSYHPPIPDIRIAIQSFQI